MDLGANLESNCDRPRKSELKITQTVGELILVLSTNDDYDQETTQLADIITHSRRIHRFERTCACNDGELNVSLKKTVRLSPTPSRRNLDLD